MKRRVLATGVACLAALVLTPATANAVPSGSANTGSFEVLPHLVEAAINCLITGTPLQQCGYTGITPAPFPNTPN